MNKKFIILPLAMMAFLIITSPLAGSPALAHGGVEDEPVAEQQTPASRNLNENQPAQAMIVGGIFVAAIIGFVAFKFLRKQKS